MRLPNLPLRTTGLAVAGTLLACGVSATGAQAATLTAEGDGYVYRAAPGEVNRLLLYGGTPGQVRFYDENAITSLPDACGQDRPNDADCPAGPVRVELLDAADTFSLSDYGAGAIVVDGGDGDDELRGYEAAAGATLLGAAGRDLLIGSSANDALRGGPGDDKLRGDAGDDELRGEDGNDDLQPDTAKAPGNDVVDGGPGTDSADDWVEPGATATPISISLDGVANDGRPGETDNVIDVERSTPYVSGRFVLSEGPDQWQFFANVDGGASTVFGRGGDDRLVGEDHDETIDGGAGNDYLEGGRRNDTLTGGPGADTILGDESDTGCTWAPEYCLVFGNDVIHARDGEADTIDCGPGTDRAVVDAVDVHSGCETVEGSAGAPGPPTGTPVPQQPAGGKVRLSPAKARLAKALRSGLRVRVSGAAPEGTVKLTARRNGRLVARGKGRAGQDGTAVVRLRFTKAARRGLRGAKRARLVIKGPGAETAATLRR